MSHDLPHFDRRAELDDSEWFARHPDERRHIRVTTHAERQRHGKPFAIVTRDDAGNHAYEFGEI